MSHLYFRKVSLTLHLLSWLFSIQKLHAVSAANALSLACTEFSPVIPVRLMKRVLSRRRTFRSSTRARLQCRFRREGEQRAQSSLRSKGTLRCAASALLASR